MRRWIVRLQQGKDDHGLYITHARNVYGTPLVARGTLEFIESLNVELRMSGHLVERHGEYLPPSERGISP